MASPYDTKPLTDKINAAMNEAAAFWGDPGNYPNLTPRQKALMIDYSQNGVIVNSKAYGSPGFLSVLFVREGFDDNSTYASVSGRLAALESTIGDVFKGPLGL